MGQRWPSAPERYRWKKRMGAAITGMDMGDGVVVPAARSLSGTDVRARFTFSENELLIRVGISAVDIDGAPGQASARVVFELRLDAV